ncbi:MAG: serine O-acetyltransferase [Alphaproteobacteria bacterium]
MSFKRLLTDLDAYIERDPAAHSRLTVALTYPGFHAVVWHRASHWLWQRRMFLIGRLLSQFSRFLTGIEIHPGATIGDRLVIDHGMGVVVGETAIIGNDVTLYHDVTLGGISPAEDSLSQKNTKRHPTLADGVIVGSGGQILGPITIGRNARVGANAVVVRDVADALTVVGVPAKPVQVRSTQKTGTFAAYGTPTADLPDPVARAIEGLLGEVGDLRQRIGELERELGDVHPVTLPLGDGEVEPKDRQDKGGSSAPRRTGS